jgi:SPRY domain
LCVGAYAIDDDLDIFLLVIASIVDAESFKKQRLQLDSATRDYLTTRLDYYQVNIDIRIHYRVDSSIIVTNCLSNITASKTIDTSGYTSLIWDASIHKYTVTVNISKYLDINIGFARSKLFDVSKSSYSSCGWYLFLHSGCLYSQNGDKGKAYSSGCKVGDTITCIYNASTSEISFEKNGASLGVAYTDVNEVDIAPVVELVCKGDSITLSID